MTSDFFFSVNRGEQNLKRNQTTCFALCTVLAPNKSYPNRKSQFVQSQRSRVTLTINNHVEMEKTRATKRKTNSDAFIDCRHRNDIRINTTM